MLSFFTVMSIFSDLLFIFVDKGLTLQVLSAVSPYLRGPDTFK